MPIKPQPVRTEALLEEDFMSQGTKNKGGNHVVDFVELRERKLEEKRKNTERIFFKQILGIYAVSAEEKIRPIEILDMSDEGMSFQVPFNPEKPWPKEEKNIPIRLYFSQETYLPIFVQVQNSRHSIDSGIRYIRYGCKIDQTTSSFPAYQQFVRFMKAYAEHAHKDLGDVTLFYL